ncbi:MAG: hypothetical protein ACTSYC_05980 [Promethearchaeota archaeon]
MIIAGGGKFGEIAVKHAIKKGYRTLLIDVNPQCQAAKYAVFKTDDLENFLSRIDSVKEGTVIFLNSDISSINNILECITPEFLIPVIPVHLLLVLIKNLLTRFGMKLNPTPYLAKHYHDVMNKEFILGANIKEGVIYLSYAKLNEICPDYCPGPPDFCPYFKRKKPITIIAYLKNLMETPELIRIKQNKNSCIYIVLESHQIKPGLGGFMGMEIEFTLNKLTSSLNLIKKQTQFILSTACNCHGIVHFMEIA